MKRVCTLRKVLRSLSKVLLEKLFYRSYIVLLSPLSSYCFYHISSQEICYDKVNINFCRKSFGSSQILVHNAQLQNSLRKFYIKC